MKRATIAVVLLIVLLGLVGCAPGVNTLTGTADAEGEVDGFLDGLWHGIIAPLTFFISLFTDGVNVYEVNNNGNWYDFGFVLGAGILFGGGSGGSRRRRSRRPSWFPVKMSNWSRSAVGFAMRRS